MLTKYQTLRNSGKLTGTIKSAMHKRAERSKDDDTPDKDKTILIPLGDTAIAYANSTARKTHPTRRNWTLPKPDRASKFVRCQINDLGNYSSRCRYIHYTYTPTFRSCGKCTAKHLVAFMGSKKVRYVAVHGWSFGVDEYGMYVVKNSRSSEDFRYHFNTDDLHSRRTLMKSARGHDTNVQLAKRNERVRKAAISKCLKHGVWVTFQDARNAGCCSSGIKSFCAKNEIDYSKYYSANFIKKFSHLDSRVSRTINVAIDRAVLDNQRGYCLINNWI